MSAKKHSDIRALALAFYRGWIPREKYVSLRGEILNAISENRKPKALNKKYITPPATAENPSSPNPGTLPGNNKILVAAAATILLISLILYLAIPAKKTPAIDQAESQSKVATSPATDTATSRFNTFLDTTFMKNSGWNQDNLNVLKFKWHALSEQEQAAVRKGSAFRRFSALLAESLAEERRKDSIVPSDKELKLITAARHLGLAETLQD